MSIVEVISCGTCGTQFAACVDGFQNKDWEKDKKQYLKFGHKVDFTDSEKLNLSNCEHPKDKRTKESAQELTAEPENQLKLF